MWPIHRCCVTTAYQDERQVRRVQCDQNVRDTRSCSHRTSRIGTHDRYCPAWGRLGPFHVVSGAARPSSLGTRCGKHSCSWSLPGRRDRIESPAPSSTAPPSRGSQVRSTWRRVCFWFWRCLRENYYYPSNSFPITDTLSRALRVNAALVCCRPLMVPACCSSAAACVHPFDTAQSA